MPAQLHLGMCLKEKPHLISNFLYRKLCPVHYVCAGVTSEIDKKPSLGVNAAISFPPLLCLFSHLNWRPKLRPSEW